MFSPKFGGELPFELKDPNQTNRFLAENIFNHFKNIDPENIVLENGVVSLTTFSSLFSLEHFAEIKILNNENSKIHYSFNYGELYKIILMVLLFALFFIKFSWWIYTVIAVFFSIAIITTNIYYVNSFIKRNIIAAVKQYTFIGDEYISKKQKEWIKNPRKCPACGDEVNEYSFKCLNCGLKISNKKISSITNTTNNKVGIQYFVKENNEKDSG
jgi:hypothetical protein